VAGSEPYQVPLSGRHEVGLEPGTLKSTLLHTVLSYKAIDNLSYLFCYTNPRQQRLKSFAAERVWQRWHGDKHVWHQEPFPLYNGIVIFWCHSFGRGKTICHQGYTWTPGARLSIYPVFVWRVFLLASCECYKCKGHG